MKSRSEKSTAWPHSPQHRLSESGSFIVTAGTYQKESFFQNPERLDVLLRGLLKCSYQYKWQLEAWAVFPNHYHFVGHSPSNADSAESLRSMLSELHSKTARWVNRLDSHPERKVWHNFWETQLTYEKSYFARLNYVHQNPVKHGLVPVANAYKWCSAAWFEQNASPAQVKTIYSFKTEEIKIYDDY